MHKVFCLIFLIKGERDCRCSKLLNFDSQEIMAQEKRKVKDWGRGKCSISFSSLHSLLCSLDHNPFDLKIQICFFLYTSKLINLETSFLLLRLKVGYYVNCKYMRPKSLRQYKKIYNNNENMTSALQSIQGQASNQVSLCLEGRDERTSKFRSDMQSARQVHQPLAFQIMITATQFLTSLDWH